MRLRFAVAFAAVALAWYVTRPGQASNAARVDVPERPAVAMEEPRPAWRATPPPSLPAPEPEEAVELEPHAPAVRLDRTAVPHVARIRWEEVTETIERLDVEEPVSFSSGSPVENEYILESPRLPMDGARPPEVAGHGTVYYVEGIDVSGLTFD